MRGFLLPAESAAPVFEVRFGMGDRFR